MDQGVIHSLKAKYRVRLIQMMIYAIDKEKLSPKFSILEAMKVLVLAWNDVSNVIIQNCFTKAGFSEEAKDDDSDDPFSTLRNLMEDLRKRDQN